MKDKVKDLKVKIKVKRTLYGEWCFRVYVPMLEILGCIHYKLVTKHLDKLYEDMSNNRDKYFKTTVEPKGER